MINILREIIEARKFKSNKFVSIPQKYITEKQFNRKTPPTNLE